MSLLDKSGSLLDERTILEELKSLPSGLTGLYDRILNEIEHETRLEVAMVQL